MKWYDIGLADYPEPPEEKEYTSYWDTDLPDRDYEEARDRERLPYLFE